MPAKCCRPAIVACFLLLTLLSQQVSTQTPVLERRAAAWRVSGASPFGLGLHFSGSADALPIQGRREPAPHLGPDVFYLLLGQPNEQRAADVFVMPQAAAVPTWIDRFRGPSTSPACRSAAMR
jgi:hypothetical protein